MTGPGEVKCPVCLVDAAGESGVCDYCENGPKPSGAAKAPDEPTILQCVECLREFNAYCPWCKDPPQYAHVRASTPLSGAEPDEVWIRFSPHGRVTETSVGAPLEPFGDSIVVRYVRSRS
jgi:hypothetical protein